jgi:hypothetical protein
LALSIPAAAQSVLPSAPTPYLNKINVALASTDIAMREIDGVSTRMAVTSACGCIKEVGDFGFMQGAAKTSPTQFAYSSGMALSNIYLSRMLWREGAKRHSPMFRIASRIVLATDIVLETRADINNFQLAGRTPKAGFVRIGR